MVRVTIEGGKELTVKATRKQMVNEYLKEIDKLDKEASRYYLLLGELQKISSQIQTERFSFKKLKKLKKRSEVQESIKTLKKHFSEE